MSKITWTAAARITDADAFKTLVAEMVEATKAEDGCETYEFYVNDEAQTVIILESYTDSDAALTHVGNFGANFAERFMGCVEMIAVHVLGDPSPALTEALDAFGARYYSPIAGFRR